MGSKSFSDKVVGIFSDREIVNSVLQELNDNGFDSEDISVLARDYAEKQRIVTQRGTAFPETETTEIPLDDNLYHDNVVYPSTMSGNYSTANRNLGDTYSSGPLTGNVNGPVLQESSVYDVVEAAPDFAEVHDVAEKDPKAMVKGATAGGTLGLIAGLITLIIPGVGPVLAAGPLAAALTAAAGGAAIGAAAGTLLGVLKDEGIPADRADFYNRSFNKGEILIVIHCAKDNSFLAREILLKHNPGTVDTF
jgi:hypothetical protein